MTIVWIIIAIIVVAIAGVLIYAATKPSMMAYSRWTHVKAPPEKIFPLINDYKNWADWSPYEKKDPAMKRTFGGAPSGKGAVYAWEGNKNVGVGRMEIADTAPPGRVTIKLDFLKPFEAHNIVDFTMESKGDSTLVTWAMRGPCPYIGKVMSVFIDMDRMVGKDFEQGLANLKAVAER